MATLEHVNLTVSDPKATADMLCTLFDWRVRWEGASMDEGYTFHVGDEESYLAVYAKGTPYTTNPANRPRRTGLNHIGITVEDLRLCEQRVTRAGFRTFNHSNYDPGERFYFLDADQIEYEVISYNRIPAA